MSDAKREDSVYYSLEWAGLHAHIVGVAFSSSFRFCGGGWSLCYCFHSNLRYCSSPHRASWSSLKHQLGQAGSLDKIDGFYELEIDDWGHKCVCVYIMNLSICTPLNHILGSVLTSWYTQIFVMKIGIGRQASKWLWWVKVVNKTCTNPIFWLFTNLPGNVLVDWKRPPTFVGQPLGGRSFHMCWDQATKAFSR